jgi:hypothetical protein
MILRDRPVDAECPGPVADSSESARGHHWVGSPGRGQGRRPGHGDMGPLGRVPLGLDRVQLWLENDAIPTQWRNSMRHCTGSQARAQSASSPRSEVTVAGIPPPCRPHARNVGEVAIDCRFRPGSFVGQVSAPDIKAKVDDRFGSGGEELVVLAESPPHSAWRTSSFRQYGAPPSCTATPPKPGSTPAASIATLPRLGCTLSSVSRLVEAEWTQCNRPAVLARSRRSGPPARPPTPRARPGRTLRVVTVGRRLGPRPRHPDPSPPIAPRPAARRPARPASVASARHLWSGDS